LIYRAVTDWTLRQEHHAESEADDDPWVPAVGLACQLAARPDL
jgi:hypothetical protein